MRLVFVLAGLVSLILTSRWLTLSESSPFAKQEDQTVESVDQNQLELSPPVATIARAVFDEPTEGVQRQPATQGQPYAPTARPLSPGFSPILVPNSGVPAQFASSSQTVQMSDALEKQPEFLVRLEYELTDGNAESLSNLKFMNTFETSVVDTGSSGKVILQVTCDQELQALIARLVEKLESDASEGHIRRQTNRAKKTSSVFQKTCVKYCETCEKLQLK